MNTTWEGGGEDIIFSKAYSFTSLGTKEKSYKQSNYKYKMRKCNMGKKCT